MPHELRPRIRATALQADWWSRWAALDFSWQGLAAKPGHDGANLQTYWRNEGERLIAEPGSDKLWTRFHCPFVFVDGTPSPKAAWTADDWRDLHQGLRTRLAMSTAAKPCLLDGVVLDALLEGEQDLPDEADYLWVRATNLYVRGDVDLRHNGWGLADFSDAWFGGTVDLTGARLLHSDFSAAIVASEIAEARPVTEAIVPVVATVEIEAVPPPRTGPGMWIAAGAAAVAIGAGIVWLLKVL